MNSRLNVAEECINDLEDRIMEITQSQHQKEKQVLKNENSLRSLWDNIKHTNIHIIRVPEEEKGCLSKMYLRKLWLKNSQI